MPGTWRGVRGSSDAPSPSRRPAPTHHTLPGCSTAQVLPSPAAMRTAPDRPATGRASLDMDRVGCSSPNCPWPASPQQ